MKYRLTGLLACILFYGMTSAQTFRLGVKGGVSIPNLKSSSSNPVSRGWSSIQGPYFGIVAEYKISNLLYMQSEINYASQGGKKSGLQAISSKPYTSFFPPDVDVPKYFYAVFSNKVHLNYLELPILLKLEYPVSDKIGIFINGGPYFGYLISAKNISSGNSNVYFDEQLTQPALPASADFGATTNVINDINRFNVGIQGGLGISLLLRNESKFFLTAGGNYGFKPIQKDKANGQSNTGAATIILGYLIKL